MDQIMAIEAVVSGILAGVGSVMAMYTPVGTTIAFAGIGGLFVHALYLTLKES